MTDDLHKTIKGLVAHNQKIREQIQSKLDGRTTNNFVLKRDELEEYKLQMIALETLLRSLYEQSMNREVESDGRPHLRLLRGGESDVSD